MSVSINTTEATKKTKAVEIDGMAWEFIPAPAGVMLELTRLGRKMKSGDATEDESADMMEKLFSYYESIFKDSTKDNSEVKQWLSEKTFDQIAYTVAKCQEA